MSKELTVVVASFCPDNRSWNHQSWETISTCYCFCLTTFAIFQHGNSACCFGSQRLSTSRRGGDPHLLRHAGRQEHGTLLVRGARAAFEWKLGRVKHGKTLVKQDLIWIDMGSTLEYEHQGLGGVPNF